jgi:hypothetical protein
MSKASVFLVTAVLIAIIVMTVKMTLQVLMLLLKRIFRWRKKARVILLVTLRITVALFGRAWMVIMDSMSYFLVILDLKTQQ